MPEGWKPSEPLPTAPSEGPDHPDVVIAAAYSRRRRKAVMWSIERDADGRCTDLVLMPGVDSIARGS